MSSDNLVVNYLQKNVVITTNYISESVIQIKLQIDRYIMTICCKLYSALYYTIISAADLHNKIARLVDINIDSYNNMTIINDIDYFIAATINQVLQF